MQRPSATALAVSLAGALLVSTTIIAACSSSNENSTDTGSTACDAPALLATKCAFSPCHDTGTKAAGFDMQAAGLADRLVGVTPPGGGTGSLASVCTNASTGMSLFYLDAGSSPATGLFLRKLNAASIPCGVQMPQAPYPKLSATETACIQTWANDVVASHSGGDAGN